jgi:ABC-type transport system involved in multi-copper enzyme maturation permease subunit
MSLVEENPLETAPNKMLLVANLKLKENVRRWQAFIWLIIPTMLLIMIYITNNTAIPGTPYHEYDFAFPGIAVYGAAMLMIRTASSFADQKKSGMLDRFDTLPLGRSNIFLGNLLADGIYSIITLIILFIIGFIGLGIYYHDFANLIFGFIVVLLYAIQSIGIGILIAAYCQSADAANPIVLMYIMPTIFASGSFFPFESPIVYFMPPFWAKQVFLQLVVLGNSLTDSMYSSSLIGTSATQIPIPLWGGLLILIVMTIGFLILGISVFQRKTSM